MDKEEKRIKMSQDLKTTQIEELKEFLRIRSISSEKGFEVEIKEAAGWLEKKLSGLGFEVKVFETSSNPIVLGQILVDEKLPTVLVYGHYDVQDVGDLDEWESEPFEPEVRRGNLYGRGVSDDKGQLFTWIVAIEELLGGEIFRLSNSEQETRRAQDDKSGMKSLPDLSSKARLPCNVKFVVEGAEEEGSVGFTEFLRKNKNLLKADVCVLSDTHCLSLDQPVITCGLRGLAYFEISVTTLDRDVHSGIYGGNVAGAVETLIDILSRIKGEDGRVNIPNFYTSVRELGKEEKIDLERFPFVKEQIVIETGAREVVGEKTRSIPERAGVRPTFDVHGVWGGYVGEGSKTVIPAMAGAKVSMRLVPDQCASEISQAFTKYVDKLSPEWAEVKIKLLAAAEPVIVDRESEFMRAAEKAYQKVFGKKPLFEYSGGSIGVIVDLKEILGVDSIMMGYGLPDDSLHGPNEKMSLSMFEKGVRTNIEFLRAVSSVKTK